MANLESTIESIFKDDYSYRYSRNLYSAPITENSYMEIPINTDVFELPIFAFTNFRGILSKQKNCDVIVAQLYSCGNPSDYRSMDAIIKDIISRKFNEHLHTIEVPGTSQVYYGTRGAIFDANLKPIMMMSWILERVKDEEEHVKYRYKRPILRLDADPCLNKEDQLQRFLSNKLLTSTLALNIYTPYFYNYNDYFIQSNLWSRESFKIKVEIDTCPFNIKKVERPSISVTNEKLLNLVEEYMGEMIP
jgi:hypothetical protein